MSACLIESKKDWTGQDIGGHRRTYTDLDGNRRTLVDIYGHWRTLVDISGHINGHINWRHVQRM